MYIENSIKGYLDDLAAKKPAPGGGSAAALEAATGCALISMVANYTVSNKKYESVKDRAVQDLGKSEELRKRLLKLVDGDVEAYTKLSNGFKKLGKDSPELDKLYKVACEVPYEICKIASEALVLCKELAKYGNKNLITDAAIASLMLESAFFAAKFNVYINLKYIKDVSFIENKHKELSAIEKNIPKQKEEIIEICEEQILK